MSRWTKFLIIVVLGAAVGLIYGWFVNPVEYVDIAPDSLRVDYKTDYVLMTAEAYQVDHDLGLAVRRLAQLGNSAPTVIVEEALNYEIQQNRDSRDIMLLKNLHDALLDWNPNMGVPTP